MARSEVLVEVFDLPLMVSAVVSDEHFRII